MRKNLERNLTQETCPDLGSNPGPLHEERERYLKTTAVIKSMYLSRDLVHGRHGSMQPITPSATHNEATLSSSDFASVAVTVAIEIIIAPGQNIAF